MTDKLQVHSVTHKVDLKSESMRAPGRAATWHLADFHETLPV